MSSSTSTHKPFTQVTVGLLLLIAVGHLLRVLGGWNVTVDSMTVPVWVSAPVVVVMTVLGIMVWRESRF